MPNIQVQTRTITGNILNTTSENAAYARTNERISQLENTAVFTTDTAIISPSMLNSDTFEIIKGNRTFDNTTSTGGFWGQVKNLDFPNKTICKFLESQSTTHITSTSETVPFFVTQRKIHYEHDGLPEEEYEDNDGYIQTRPKAELFTRVASEYHEIIGDGYCVAGRDSSTPNFTGFAVSCYNKFKGNVGMTGITARMDEKAFTDAELYITDDKNGWGSSKSCAVFASTIRRSNYNQGRHGGSYSIGMEAFMINSPTEDGADGTDGYFPNPKGASWKTWTAAIHTVCGGRRPVSAGIFMNGYSTSCKTSEANAADRKSFILRNGNLNGIIIGASSMAVRGGVPIKDEHGNYITRTVIKGGVEVEELVTTSGNSPDTVGINMSSWKKSGNYGYTAIKTGYVPRVLHSRGSALFQAPAFKILNENGDMPVAISSGSTGMPVLWFKTGADNSERPNDVSHAKIGYNTSTSYLNTVSDGDIRFVVNGTFSNATNQSDEEDEDEHKPVSTESSANCAVYKFQGFNFISSVPSSTAENPKYASLGSATYKWGNIYANNGTINTSDRNLKENIQDIDDRVLKAWSKVGYKIFKFKGGDRKHFGVIAQDIDDAFESEGLNARDYGLFCEDTDEDGNIVLGIRYAEALALECALLRNKIGG